MTFVSYAQNFEDVLLWRALRHVEGGRYLDIGAQDPTIDSVSNAFYQAGWRGIHVEPLPFYAAKLREARPEETVIEAAVTDEIGPMPFHEIADTGLSTGKEEIARNHEANGYRVCKILVPCVRLDRLFELVENELHWMKVDVEGMEADVLRSWGDSQCRPWILVVESTAPNSQERTERLWIDEVVRRGYKQVFFDGLSCYFLHESHRAIADWFAAPANVFDAFSITTQHFSAAGIRGELAAANQRFEEERRRAEQLALDLIAAEQEHRAAIVDLARFEERSAQLQDKLDRTDESSRQSVAQLGTLERLVAELRGVHDEARSNFERQIAEARSIARQREQERDEALARQEQAHRDADRLKSDLEDEITQLRNSIGRADTLIRNAAAESTSRWQRIGEALGFARPRPSWQALASWSGHSGMSWQAESEVNQLETTRAETGMQSSASTQGRNPYLRANSLAELLSWHDVDFVRCAYVTVLGRQPDPEGEAYYTGRVRNGHSKLEILRQLRRSPEGPNHDPGIAGFDRALGRSRLERLPLIGDLVRIFTRGEGDGAHWRMMRATANKLATLEQSHAGLFDEDLARLVRLEEKADRALQFLAHLDQTLVGGQPPDFLSSAAKDVFKRLSTSSNFGGLRD